MMTPGQISCVSSAAMCRSYADAAVAHVSLRDEFMYMHAWLDDCHVLVPAYPRAADLEPPCHVVSARLGVAVQSCPDPYVRTRRCTDHAGATVCLKGRVPTLEKRDHKHHCSARWALSFALHHL